MSHNKKEKMGVGLSTTHPPAPALHAFQHATYQLLKSGKYMIVTTLTMPIIAGTVLPAEEEAAMNTLIDRGAHANQPIVVYGANWSDEAPLRKCAQLKRLGFRDVAVYVGGAHEWLLMRELYGAEAFPLERTDEDNDDFSVDPLDYQPHVRGATAHLPPVSTQRLLT